MAASQPGGYRYFTGRAGRQPANKAAIPVSFVIYKVCVTAVVTAAIYLKGDNSHFGLVAGDAGTELVLVGIVIWNMFCIFTWHA